MATTPPARISSASSLRLIKWIVGTGVAVTAAVIGTLRLFS